MRRADGALQISTEGGYEMFRALLGFAIIAAFAIGLAPPESVAQAQQGGDARERITGSWRVVYYEL